MAVLPIRFITEVVMISVVLFKKNPILQRNESYAVSRRGNRDEACGEIGLNVTSLTANILECQGVRPEASLNYLVGTV